ncbi:MAG: NifB/NifX family molybdenum-iron cluster-binding protein [Dehalococcoidia bacterium]|nr:NifB/NifX family molybdenum-iron cluster-binding protein [Dehalococcoidia bacterium]
MKIAVVSDDGVTVSQHFGRAQMYVVLTIEDGRIVAEENRPKLGHGALANLPHGELDALGRRGFGEGAELRHRQMAAAIGDCQALISGGMGWGAQESLQQSGIEVVITDVADVKEAALRHAAGNLPNLVERLH